ETDRGIADQPIDKRIARHASDGIHQMRQRGAVHRVDPLQQRGHVGAHCGIRMRLERVDELLDLLEDIGLHVRWCPVCMGTWPPRPASGSRATADSSVAMVIVSSHTWSITLATGSLNSSPNSCTAGST